MPMRKYKVMAGAHGGPDFTAEPLRDDNGVALEYPTKNFNKGDVVHSEVDLAKKYPLRFKDVGESKYKNEIPKKRKMHSSGVPIAEVNAPVNEGRTVHGHKASMAIEEEQDPVEDDDTEEGVKADAAEDEEDEDKEEAGVSSEATLKTMDMNELRELAKEEGIELKGPQSKDAIIKKILAASKKK